MEEELRMSNLKTFNEHGIAHEFSTFSNLQPNGMIERNNMPFQENG